MLESFLNLYRTENTLSGVWFCELLSDWSKTGFESQDLVSGHKVKKSVLTHTPTLDQYLCFFFIENCSIEFHKIKCRVFDCLLPGRQYNSMQNIA